MGHLLTALTDCLRVPLRNVVTMQPRKSNMKRREIPLRRLVKEALRMRLSRMSSVTAPGDISRT